MRRIPQPQLAPAPTATPESASDPELEDEEEEIEPERVVTKQKPKTRTVAIGKAVPPKTKPVPPAPVSAKATTKAPTKAPTAALANMSLEDVAVGFVYTKAGKREAYQTPSLKYYTLRQNGTKAYMTARVDSGKVKIHDS